MRDGKIIHEGRPPNGFTVADIARRQEFSDLHEQTIRDNLHGLARKGWLVQTVSGRGRSGVWARVQEKAILNSDNAKTALIPVLGPISGSDLEFKSSRIYEGLDHKPVLQPAWNAILPLQNLELLSFRIKPETNGFAAQSLESASLSSRSQFHELPQTPEPTIPGLAVLDDFGLDSKLPLKADKTRPKESAQ